MATIRITTTLRGAQQVKRKLLAVGKAPDRVNAQAAHAGAAELHAEIVERVAVDSGALRASLQIGKG